MKTRISSTSVFFCFFVTALTFLNFTQVNAQEEAITLYNEAKARYYEDEYKEALTLMKALREKFPESIKTDDALWYIGKCQEKLGDPEAAIESFKAILNLSQKSNRYTEAALDLGEIYYKQKKYEDIISILEKFRKWKINDDEKVEIHLLLAKSFYMLGFNSGHDPDSYFLEAEKIYTNLLENDLKKKYEQEALYWLGKTYYRLLENSKTGQAFSAYRNLALTTIQEASDKGAGAKYSKLEEHRIKVKEMNRPEFHIDIATLGGTNLMVLEPGAKAGIDFSFDFPIGLTQEISLFTGIEHTNFGKKTFNFVPEEKDAGDVRLLQMTDTVNAGILWKAGLNTPFSSKLKTYGKFSYAEDPEDINISVGIDEKLSYDFSSLLTAGLNLDGKLKLYPNYLINSRKIDHVLVQAGPECILTFSDLISLDLGYEFAFKHYLDSKYDTEAGGTADENKQFFTHTVGTDIHFEPASNIRFSLGYDFSYNLTQNYNIIISANPGPQYFEGYYDFYEHDIDARFTATLFDRVKTDLKAGYAIRNFLNYEARDETNTFTGDLREDSNVYIAGSIFIFLLQQSDKNSVDLSIILEGEFESEHSNMNYESSIDTNYDSTGFFAGIGFSYN